MRFSSRQLFILAAAPALLLLGACQAFGPGRGSIASAGKDARFPSASAASPITVVPVSPATAARWNRPEPRQSFAEALGSGRAVGTEVGVGDVLEVVIWEAPPAVLFNALPLDTRAGSAISTSRPNALPETVVGPSGTINVPFAGEVAAVGRPLRAIEQDIIRRLRGRANDPQVLVRLARNVTSNVTVVGDVATATRLPLTPRGERLLDALAQAGGTRQPVNRMTVQVSRGGRTVRMPLQQVITDPRNNIVLQADDVVTALFQPFSFTVLGAAGRNEEVAFEATGLTLAQALGRIGGLQDGRADPRGVFVFRWEDPSAAPIDDLAVVQARRADGRVPVIYSVDLRDPATFFIAQTFEMRDRDLIYVTNSPVAELQRFVNIIASTILPVATVNTAVRGN